MEQTERSALPLTPERAWVAAAVAVTLALALGSLVLTDLVWDRFLWHYFWGPIFADANNAACVVKADGATRLLQSTTACTQADAAGGIVAEPGYTVVSEIGYAATLVFFIVGVLFLLRDLGVGEDRGLFFGLVPFMFFGGALRVVEDANDAALGAPGVSESIVPYPANTLIISPIIYFVVFAVALAALVVAVWFERSGRTETYATPLAYMGTGVLALTMGYLLYLSNTTEYVTTHPQMLVLVLLFSGLIAGGLFLLYERVAPDITRGTGYIGLVVLFGHVLDGVANVIAADWAIEIGLPFEYSAKHPVNRFIIEATAQYMPASVTATIGDSWPFLLVKIIAATLVIWIFDEEVFRENPRYAILLLVAILAVGLGPGTRDMLRATFGI